MKTITIGQILKLGPYEEYTKEKLKNLRKSVCGRRKKITAHDILKVDISFNDKIWIIFKSHFFIDFQLHNIALFCAEKVALPRWRKYYPEDNRLAEAIRIKKLWLQGKATDEELREARNGAYAAYAATANAVDAAYAVYAAAARAAANTHAAINAARDAAGKNRKKAEERILNYALKLYDGKK